MPQSGASPVSPHNRLGLDWHAEAHRLGSPFPASAGVPGIIDAHTHIHGPNAARVYDRARRLFGVTRTYSMTQLPMAAAVRDALGDSIRFITMPVWSDPDRESAHRGGYLRTIERFHAEFGSRMIKLWASPRLRDIVPSLKGQPFGATDLAEIDAPERVRHCELAQKLGMMFMVHVADPDTWFATKYADARVYGAKRQQYEGLERMLDRFTSPWIAAHMGGWPEDLAFLDGLLSRHPNLHIDTSATKWVVRELSKHEPGSVRAFFDRWRGRILFGTDLVVMEDQLSPSKSMGSPMGDLASSPDEAFDLYCSRHWALRTLFETTYDGPSPIVDPDLAMVDPTRFDATSTPRLRGCALPPDLLRSLYHDATANLVDRWWAEHP